MTMLGMPGEAKTGVLTCLRLGSRTRHGHPQVCGGWSAERAAVPVLEVAQDLLAGQAAGGTHHAAAGVGAGAALVVAVDRRAVLAPPRRGPEEVHLRGEELAGEDVALRQPDRALDVEGRLDLAL